jgi:Integrase core domain
VAHANARLTRREGSCCASASRPAGPSPTSPPRWGSPAPALIAGGAAIGSPAGLIDRSSRAHTHPGRLPAAVEAEICRLWMDRPTGQLIRRYERAHPGELIHLDVKKLGRLRDGGGHRVHGRDSTQHRTRDQHRACRGRVGYDYVQAAVDDHSRLDYVEVLADERGPTCPRFLCRAGKLLAAHGITIQRVLTDNAMAYRHSRQFQARGGRAGRGPAFLPPLPS